MNEQQQIIKEELKIIKRNINKLCKKVQSKNTGLALKVVSVELMTLLLKAKYSLENKNIEFETKLYIINQLPQVSRQVQKSLAA